MFANAKQMVKSLTHSLSEKAKMKKQQRSITIFAIFIKVPKSIPNKKMNQAKKFEIEVP